MPPQGEQPVGAGGGGAGWGKAAVVVKVHVPQESPEAPQGNDSGASKPYSNRCDHNRIVDALLSTSPNSLDSGRVPLTWKIANLTRLFKTCCNVDIGEPTSGGQATLTGSSSINQLDRGRRGISCASDEYKPSWKDYCCNKCTEGFYRTADCTGPGTRTNCSSCPPETFTQYANHLKKCKSCLQCDPVFNQVEVRKCESTRDRVCGCPKGMFQKKIETLTFYCQNCSSCKIVLRECSGYNDTICHCDHGQYYNTQTKECQTCDSCNQGLTCISMCSQTSAPVNHHIFILAVFSSSVLFVVVVGLMAYAMKNKWKKLSGLQSLTETGTGVQSEVSESENLKKPVWDIS
ncbi:tumor necrosis factor receptor superfamily member 1A-like, partial [Carcharodon carcharias]|uniref:tumor necrosis factor receptor superfamily member 1A-like n=1 Tax=Carcharodon carcharias TaxID=13397 RepID=UPI001B7E9877